MSNRKPDYEAVPDPIGEHYWHPNQGKGYWSIIKPYNATTVNAALNPSVEANLDHWEAISLPAIGPGNPLRTYDYALHGNQGMVVTTNGGNQGVGYQMEPQYSPGVAWSACISIDGPAGSVATFRFEHDADANAGPPTTVTLRGFPVRICARLLPTSANPTASLLVAVRFDRAGEYRVDGLMLTQTVNPVTLYFDGDSDEAAWSGTPHASTSVMSGSNRTFGERINLNEIGFNVTSVSGFGLTPKQLITTSFARQNGAHLQRVKDEPRAIAITGTFEGTPEEMHVTRCTLIDALSWRFKNQCTQDLLLVYALYDDCGCRISEELTIPVTYQSGLEATWGTLDRERATLVFIANHDQGFSVMFDESANLTLDGDILITNEGDDDNWPEIHMWPGVGGMEVEAVHNITTGHSVYFGTTAAGGNPTALPLAWGEYAILRTNPAQRISLDLYDAVGSTRIMHYIRYPQSQLGMFRMIPGLNSIQVDMNAISTGSRVFVKQRWRYQSVDCLANCVGCLEITGEV